MNATNRAVNRIVVGVVGLVVLISGASLACAALWQPARDTWQTAGHAAVTWMQGAEANTLVPGSTLSGLVAAVLAVLLLVIVVAVAIVAHLGGGRSQAIIRVEAAEGAQGPITIGEGFAKDAIGDALGSREEILSSSVSTWRVRNTRVLRVEVTPRQGTSPADVAASVTALVENLAALTGRQTLTYVSIRSGIRARFAADLSRVDQPRAVGVQLKGVQ